MSLAALELQRAVFAALAGDAALTAALGGAGFYDRTPARTPFPYLTFGPASIHDWSTDTEAGSEHLFTLDIWAGRTGKSEALALMERVDAVLHDAALTLKGGYRLVNLRRQSAEIRFDEDLSVHHGLMRFRAAIEPA